MIPATSSFIICGQESLQVFLWKEICSIESSSIHCPWSSLILHQILPCFWHGFPRHLPVSIAWSLPDFLSHGSGADKRLCSSLHLLYKRGLGVDPHGRWLIVWDWGGAKLTTWLLLKPNRIVDPMTFIQIMHCISVWQALTSREKRFDIFTKHAYMYMYLRYCGWYCRLCNIMHMIILYMRELLRLHLHHMHLGQPPTRVILPSPFGICVADGPCFLMCLYWAVSRA